MRGICLITAGVDGALEEVFRGCGLDVWTPRSAEDVRVCDAALCLVIDMPRDGGYRTLRLFRDYGVATPALLIVDPGREVPVSELDCGHVMDVLPRDANPLRILRWIQSLLAARHVIEETQRRSA